MTNYHKYHGIIQEESHSVPLHNLGEQNSKIKMAEGLMVFDRQQEMIVP